MYNVFNAESLTSKPLPLRSSLVNYSMFRTLESPINFRSFSIKYVCDGCEQYTINGSKYNVFQKQYILANHLAEGKVLIDDKSIVKGICIDIAPEILSEVVASQRRPDTNIADLDLDIFFNSSDFLINQYDAQNSNLGLSLLHLENIIQSAPFQNHQFTKETYFTLAENIVQDHIPIFKKLQSLNSIKPATKNDLLKKIQRGKEYIDVHFKNQIDIKEIASIANMSEYHFFRIFKTVMGISPYQYILQLRLYYARQLMIEQDMPISEIATLAGFNDISNFSKTFKKEFGYSPSKIK
jgi:AraC family transcriptional regulator